MSGEQDGPEFRILSGYIHLETSKGVFNARVTPDNIQIRPLSVDIWDESLAKLKILPISTAPKAEQGKSENILREYERQRLEDPLFNFVANHFGANPESTWLTNALKRNNIRSPEALSQLNGDEIIRLHRIGRGGVRFRRLLELRASVAQTSESEQLDPTNHSA